MSTTELQLKGGAVALVDSEDYDRVLTYPAEFTDNLHWCVIKERNRMIAVIRPSGGGFQRTIRLQHVVLGLEDTSIHVRFLNGNSLDCRKENLKVGHSIRSELTPRIRFREKSNEWVATLAVESIYLGFFKEEGEAIKAYHEVRSAVIKVIAEYKKKFSYVKES